MSEITSSTSPSSSSTSTFSSRFLLFCGISTILLFCLGFTLFPSSNRNDNSIIIISDKNDDDQSSLDRETRQINNNNNNNNKDCKPPPPVLRLEPTVPWKRGQPFPPGKTPLTMLKNGEATPPALPADWDGGYGWVFVKYHPSPFELKWKEKSKPIEINPGTPLCNLLTREFKRELGIYESQYGRMPSNSGAGETCNMKIFPPKEPMKFDDEVFSRFEYEWKCTRPPCKTPNANDAPKIGQRKFTYIEPLVGLLRNPRSCRPHYTLVDKNYMIVDTWSLMNPSRSTISPPDPKVIYVDGGASIWDSGGGGASQNWFHRVYQGKCLNFSDWLMFEALKHEPAKVFKLLPGYAKPGYRWYNIFLTTQIESWDNPLNHLLVEARKEDVVIVKIDFDSPAVETALMQLILDYPQVAELIDELVYEDHVKLETLQGLWWSQKFTRYHSHSLKLFTDLRDRGIRAHSWV